MCASLYNGEMLPMDQAVPVRERNRAVQAQEWNSVCGKERS